MIINTLNLNFCLSSTKTQVQKLKKDVSNNSEQGSITIAHNKTQVTHARFKCAFKNSSCDSPLSKILNFTLLASNSSSSSTNVQELLNTKIDSIFKGNGSKILTLTKMNTCMITPLGLTLIFNQYFFQLTQNHKVSFQGM